MSQNRPFFKLPGMVIMIILVVARSFNYDYDRSNELSSLREFRRSCDLTTLGFGLPGFGKSIKNYTSIDQTWDQSGPEGRQGVPENQQQIEQVKNTQTQEPK